MSLSITKGANRPMKSLKRHQLALSAYGTQRFIWPLWVGTKIGTQTVFENLYMFLADVQADMSCTVRKWHNFSSLYHVVAQWPCLLVNCY